MKISSREKNEVLHFNKMAKMYDSNYGYNNLFTKEKIVKKTKKVSSYIKSYYKKKSKLKILEIGSGTGEYTQHIAKKFTNDTILASDISPEILREAKIKCKAFKNISYTVKSAYKTDLKSNSIDAVVGFYVLHHIDYTRTAKELHRILKPGGIAVFYEPNLLNPLVFLVKKIPFLKKMVGDSPNETAINLFSIENSFKNFELISSVTTEYVPTFSFLPYWLKKFIENATINWSKVYFLKFLGGSVFLAFKKV